MESKIQNEARKDFLKRFRKLQSLVEIPKTDPIGVDKRFVKYKYRNNEDILKAANKIIDDNNLDLILTQTEYVSLVGSRYYIKSTSSCKDINSELAEECSTHVREDEARTNSRGQQAMDSAQYSGACVSYARKYSLCGLLAIDDGFDNDDIAHSAPQNRWEDTTNGKVVNAKPVANTPPITQERKSITVHHVSKKTSKNGKPYYSVLSDDQYYTTFDEEIEKVVSGQEILADLKITDKNGMTFASLHNITVGAKPDDTPDLEIPF